MKQGLKIRVSLAAILVMVATAYLTACDKGNSGRSAAPCDAYGNCSSAYGGAYGGGAYGGYNSAMMSFVSKVAGYWRTQEKLIITNIGVWPKYMAFIRETFNCGDAAESWSNAANDAAASVGAPPAGPQIQDGCARVSNFFHLALQIPNRPDGIPGLAGVTVLPYQDGQRVTSPFQQRVALNIIGSPTAPSGIRVDFNPMATGMPPAMGNTPSPIGLTILAYPQDTFGYRLRVNFYYNGSLIAQGYLYRNGGGGYGGGVQPGVPVPYPGGVPVPYPGGVPVPYPGGVPGVRYPGY